MKRTWNQQEAIELCVLLEPICKEFGCHIALSGGCLYKIGERKDADLILYRIRQCPKIDFEGMFAAFEKAGVTKLSGFGFCHKAVYQGKPIDFLSPEEEGDEYPEDSSEPLTEEDISILK